MGQDKNDKRGKLLSYCGSLKKTAISLNKPCLTHTYLQDTDRMSVQMKTDKHMYR